MSNLAEFRINMGDLTEPELSDASKPAADPSSLGFVIQNSQNAALIGMDGGGVAGAELRGGALVQQNTAAAEQREREKKESRDTFMLLALLDRINDLESDLAAKYGENFAEDLLADLKEQGLVQDVDYNRIMMIEDQDERRQAIAAHIQNGLADGTIGEDDLKGHEWAQEWLQLHHQAAQTRDLEATGALKGKLGADEISADAKDEATTTVLKNSPDIKSSFEVAAERQAVKTGHDNAGQNLVAGLDLDKLSFS